MQCSCKTTKDKEVPAVSAGAYTQFGCPHCGYRDATFMRGSAAGSVWSCADEVHCGKRFAVLTPGFGALDFSVDGETPKLMPHPRQGTPSHR